MAVPCWVDTYLRSGWQYTFWEDTDSQSKWQYHVGCILIFEVGGSIRSGKILIPKVNGSSMLGGYKWHYHVGWILISEVGGSIRSEWILISKVNDSNMLGGYLFPKWVAVYVLGRY